MGKIKICNRCNKLTGKASFDKARCVCTKFEKLDHHGRENEQKCLDLINKQK